MIPMHTRHFSCAAYLFVLLAWLVAVPAEAQLRMSDIPWEVREELESRGIEVEQALLQAERLGIDLRSPQRAALRARQLGVPESQIQEMLRAVDAIQRAQALIDASRQIRSEEVLPGYRESYGMRADTLAFAMGTTGLDTTRRLEWTEPSPYFGYDLFKRMPGVFKPSTVGPVDEAYLVGPGDELRLTVWGAAEFQYDLQVDREGRVYISNVGQLMVAGKRLARLRQDVKRWLSRTYAGLEMDPPTVFMDITVTRLRPIRVFVLGEVAQPGGYSLSSYSTVFNALYSIGGPLTRGSLRNIQVIREGKVLARVDFYSYLLKGYNPNPAHLQDNDHIFIPLRGKTVSISGEIKRPAIYELKAKENFSQLLEYSGGLTANAYFKRVQIERILPYKERNDPSMAREVMDVDLEPVLAGKKNIPLFDGDSIRVFSILDILENAVSIYGAVKQPGRYELDESILTIRDLIMKADSLTGDAYLGKADLVRTREDSSEVLISVDVEEVLADRPTQNLPLLPRDELFIYSVQDLVVEQFVTILGAVKKPGEYSLQENMTVVDLIFKAGGLTEDAYLVEAKLSRLLNERRSPDEKAVLISVPLNSEALADIAFALGDTVRDPQHVPKVLLRHRDIVNIRSDPDYKLQDRVSVTGEVKFPGQYTLLTENEALSDVIERAGGILPSGYAKGGRLIREGELVVIPMEDAIGGKQRADVTLMPGDEIIIPPKPNTVAVRGNVAIEGLIKYAPGRRLSYYLEQAGGTGEETENMYLTQASGATFKLRRFLWLFSSNPVVDDGAIITVTEKPEEEKVKPDIGKTITDVFALITSAVTIIVLAQRAL